MKNEFSILKYLDLHYDDEDSYQEKNVFLNQVIANLNELNNNINEINNIIENCEDTNQFYFCLWVMLFKKMIKDIKNFDLNEEHIESLKQLDYKIKYPKTSIIKYLNAYYNDIFNNNWDLNNRILNNLKTILEIVFNNLEDRIHIDTNVILYLEKNITLFILDHFDSIKEYYLNDLKNFDRLFSRTNNNSNESAYINLFLNSNKVDTFKSYAQKMCDKTIEKIKSIKPRSINYIELMELLKEYKRLACYYKIPEANFFKEYIDKITLEIKGTNGVFLNENGKKFLNYLNETKNINDFINITHEKIKDKFVNKFQKVILTDNSFVLSDVFENLDMPQSEKFPYSKQGKIEIFMICQTLILLECINNDNLTEKIEKFVYAISKNVQKKYFKNTIDITNEVLSEVENLKFIYKIQDSPKHLFQGQLNGCCKNICGTIEKVLRNIIYKNKKNTSYFDVNKFAIGKLSNYKNELAHVSEGLLEAIIYYLNEDSNDKLKTERPGYDIRNRLMHNQDNIFMEIGIGTAFDLLYLLLSLIVDLYCYVNQI